MDEKIFDEEREQLKKINEKIDEEENQIENDLLHSDMNYSLEELAKAQVLMSKVKKLSDIKNIKSKPYFARMDFTETGKAKEKLYIGKISLLDSKSATPIIVDWRAPIANLYYEGRLGKSSYEAVGEQIEGEVSLKRQYIIEGRKLQKYVDIDVTGNDELLQNALEQKADDRLKNIVATIQDSQNKIIRASMSKPLVVQGVAGSGKTTIALHRIAYLIYNYEKEFKPEEFMIIAPNKFFLNYISNILPDLGVNNVKQCTFEDFAYDVIGKKLKISDNNEKLVTIVNKEFDSINKGNVDIMIKESKFKSSINFKKILDEYLTNIENNFVPKENFEIYGNIIMTYNEIDYLFKHTYKIFNFSARASEIEKNLLSALKRKSDQIIEQIKFKRSEEIHGLSGAERVRVYELFDSIINSIEKGGKKLVKEFMKKFPKCDCIEYYRAFIEDYLPDSNEVLKYLKKNTSKNLSKKEFAFEDLAPIMYLQFKIFGVKEKCNLRHVVVDEAQDYGELQFDVLKTILNSNSMTILGDIAQGVHFYRGIENWKRFIDVEFKDVNVEYTTLEKTYRTTKEIMDIANSVIDKLPEYEKESIVKGEPVIDRKNCINIDSAKNYDELSKKINERIDIYKKAEFKSIAIIGKDINECEMLNKKLSKIRSDVKLIESKDSEYNAGISIVPSYLAKGLEFDCVLLSNVSSEKYQNQSLDIKLLYVAITRAMSKLDIFYIDEKSELL